MGHRETPFQKQCLDWLNSSTKRKFARTNSGQVKVRGGWMHLCEGGWGDITGAAYGYPVMIECKVDGVKTDKKRAEDQDKIRREWMEAGGRYYRVKTLDELKMVIGELERSIPF